MSLAALVADPDMQFQGLTTDQYDALVATGSLDEARVELLDGGLFAMAPQGPMHSGFTRRLAAALRRRLDAATPDAYFVRQHSPLRAGQGSEPEPDLYVYDASDDSLTSHPASAHLVVEVAVTSQGRDLVHKPRLYAEGGFAELWVVDLPRAEVVVHRDPRLEPVPGYASVQRWSFGTELSVLGVTVRLADLLD